MYILQQKKKENKLYQQKNVNEEKQDHFNIMLIASNENFS